MSSPQESLNGAMNTDHCCVSGEGRVGKMKILRSLDPPGQAGHRHPVLEGFCLLGSKSSRWVLAGAVDFGFLSGASVPLEILPTVNVQSTFISSALIWPELSSTDYILKIKSPE